MLVAASNASTCSTGSSFGSFRRPTGNGSSSPAPGAPTGEHAPQTGYHWPVMRMVAVVLAVALLAARDEAALITLSIVGTSDLHGAALAGDGVGGLPLLAGYVNNLRRARALDGGAVLVVDSGDTFQGDSESNLSEGGVVVDAYNAIGYAAEAIGNHDF